MVAEERKERGLYARLGNILQLQNTLALGYGMTESMKNDIAVAQRLGITATTLEGILTVKGQGRR